MRRMTLSTKSERIQELKCCHNIIIAFSATIIFLQEWTAHILQWKVLVGAMFLVTVAARATVLIILCCDSTISMATSAATIQAVLVSAYLWNLHKLLGFAFTVTNNFFVIIYGLWT